MSIPSEILQYEVYEYLPIGDLYRLSTTNRQAREVYQRRIASTVAELEILREKGFYGLRDIDRMLLSLIGSSPQVVADVYSKLNKQDFEEIFFRTLIREGQYDTILRIFTQDELDRYINMGYGSNIRKYAELLLRSPDLLDVYEFIPSLFHDLFYDDPDVIARIIDVHPDRQYALDQLVAAGELSFNEIVQTDTDNFYRALRSTTPASLWSYYEEYRRRNME